MHIKRFEAPTVKDALRRVREDLGPDALVLSTRTLRRGGSWFGRFATSVVEVTAAVDRDAAPPTGAAARGPRDQRVAPDSSWRELQLTRALIDPLETEVRGLRRAVERIEHGPSLAEEIAEIRQLAADLARRPTPAEPGDAGPLAVRLLAAGVAPHHAESLCAGADDDAAVRIRLGQQLEARLRAPRDDDPPIELFVGPCGAGKTTTLAKIAGRCAEPPALVTTDAHRLGGDAALRRYARDLTAPFAVAVSGKELTASLRKLDDRRVLIDTAGCSSGDAEGVRALRKTRKTLGRKARVHLVLDATTKERDLGRQIDRYRDLEPESLVITKLDESEDLGNVVNLLLDDRLPPLTWLAHGRRVPDDLQVADPTELATRILGEGS